MNQKEWKVKKVEPEYKGSVWTHPYMIYLYVTVVLFFFLIAMGYFAYQSGWLPNA